MILLLVALQNFFWLHVDFGEGGDLKNMEFWSSPVA
jgi:hypothetical protein